MLHCNLLINGVVQMKKIKEGDYVVLNKNPDASLFLVTGADGRNVTLIDADLPMSIKQRGYTCDASLVYPASKKQLAA